MRIAGRLVYNVLMARGWESKSVEDQISEAESRKELRAKADLTSYQRERQARREALLLDRVRITRELGESRNPRYRALLERSLAHIEAELEKLGAEDFGH